MTPEQRAQEYALNNCPACNDRGYEGQCDCNILAAAYLAGLTDRKGMKWVKASERLPDEGSRVIIKWDHSGNPEWRRIDISDREQLSFWVEKEAVHIDSLYWLDESTSTPPDSELLEALENTVADIIEATRAAILKHKRK